MTMFNRPCAEAGCRNLTRDTYCEDHQHLKRDFRASAYKRGYDARWKRYRKAFLSNHPLCEECLRNDKVTLSTVVDHIIPHKGSKMLFWAEHNHQALCETCHNKKTAGEDMGAWDTHKGLQ